MVSRNDYIGKYFGNYRIVAELATGGSSSVYVAQHSFLPRRSVAIKVLHPEQLSSAQKQDLFLQEAQLLDMLKHPSILSLVDVGLDEGLPYVITEYAAGGSLRERMERQGHCPLPLEEALTVLSQVGQALDYAHQHDILHGDLKPENIVFNREGDALLADFGIATQLTSEPQRQIRVFGSVHYMAPEQFEGIRSKEGDQYSLGCIAYELMTGYQPFTDLSLRGVMAKHQRAVPIAPTQHNALVPAHIEVAILKALAKQPSDRHSDISAFLTALGTSSASLTSAQATPSSSTPVQASDTDATLESSEPSTSVKSKEQWLDEALALHQGTRYAEALVAFDHAQAQDPDDAYIYIGKGLALSDLGQYEESLPCFEQALARDPDDAYAYMGKGFVLRMLGRDAEAIAAYEQAIGLDPTETDAYIGKGLTLEHMQQYDDALLGYEEALFCTPNSLLAWQNKARLLRQLGRAEAAEQASEKVQHLMTIADMRSDALPRAEEAPQV